MIPSLLRKTRCLLPLLRRYRRRYRCRCRCRLPMLVSSGLQIWLCPTCTFANPVSRRKCSMCLAGTRPAGMGRSQPLSPRAPGDANREQQQQQRQQDDTPATKKKVRRGRRWLKRNWRTQTDAISTRLCVNKCACKQHSTKYQRRHRNGETRSICCDVELAVGASSSQRCRSL